MTLAYLNYDLSDFPGEIWKDVPYKLLHGMYEISNKGRVKSLNRIVIRKNGRQMTVNEKILHQGKKIHKNPIKKDNFTLFVLLPDGLGGYKNFHVAVLVLKAFKKQTEYSNVTHHINGISYDNRLENLTFENLKTKRIIEYKSKVRDAKNNTYRFNEFRAEEFTKGDRRINRNHKTKRTLISKKQYPITIFILKTKEIFTFSSIKNASDLLNIKEYTIRNALTSPRKDKCIQIKKGVMNIEQFRPLLNN